MVVKLSLQRAKALCVKGIIMPAKDQSLAKILLAYETSKHLAWHSIIINKKAIF